MSCLEPAMDKGSTIRVKFTFETKCKLAKLDKAANPALSSMANLRKLIYKHFPEIEEMVERPLQMKQLLAVTCKDPDGDNIMLENDDDLDAMELSQNSNVEFSIDLISAPLSAAHPASKHVMSVGMVSTNSAKYLSAGNYKTKLCRNFQSGFCPYGERCSFLHDLAGRSPHANLATESFKASSLARLIDTKLKPCRNLLEFGSCRYGESCRFSHDLAEPREHERDRSLFQTEPSRSHDRPNVGNLQFSKVVFHQHTTRFASRKGGPDYDYWLNYQAGLNPAENIETLSSTDKCLPILFKVVNDRDLPHDAITRFVKLLAREEIRTSLLRQKTNQIYGALVGSPFLLQLNAHIENHLGMIPTLKEQDLRPYLELTEELQSRTADGWKEVPLNALKSVVSKLETSTAKDELNAMVSRLADQRERLQRILAVAPTEDQNFEVGFRGGKFRQMSILPNKEELLDFQAGKKSLPVNRIGIQYSRVSDYLETHFQLLREDSIDPLRQGIKAYRSNRSDTKGNPKDSGSSTKPDLRIYLGVQVAGVQCGDQEVDFVLSFHLPSKEKTIEQWESSKKLMNGALLCISSDQFETYSLGVVSRRDVKELEKGLVAIRIMGESDANVAAGLQREQNSRKKYVMVESTTAYFESYIHVLKALQREDMEEMPFTKYLLSLERSVNPPSYLLRRKSGDEYDFSSVFPDIQKKLGQRSIRIMEFEWPSGWADSLDEAQLDALKQGLTKELAIIQGPPGTGKTFLGLMLVKLFLANLQRNPGHDSRRQGRWWAERGVLVNEEKTYDISGPILIICKTNHALDQFLEGIYHNGETNLIRIGGRSKSVTLQDTNLQTLVQRQRSEREVERSHHLFSGQAREEKSFLQSQIEECIAVMGTNLVTSRLLNGIATREQIQSLFWMPDLKDAPSRRIVEFWLKEDRYTDDPGLARPFFVNEYEQDSESGSSRGSSAAAAEVGTRGRMIPLPKSEPHDDGEWIQARRRQGGRHGRRENPGGEGLEIVDHNPEEQNGWRLEVAAAGANALGAKGNEQNPRLENERNPGEGGGPVEEYCLQDLVWTSNVWELNLKQRRKLHEYWVQVIRTNKRNQLTRLTREYNEACKIAVEVDYEVQLSLLRMSKVVGMTTTGAAKYHDVLKALKSEIILVEEAAEILEGHILAALSSSVKHLVLIGDHLQLRPSVAVDRLAVEHKLDVSMFERLVRSGVEHITLQEQRRMRPSIAKLMRSLYPNLRDHESVTHYEDVKGVKPNVFFFDHQACEDNVRDASSKVNSTEARLVVELCIYLLNQGCYKAQDIAILATYSGQLVEIKALLRARCRSKFYRRPLGVSPQPEGEEADIPRVSSVDDYQGEESDIIILSLVRSNTIVTGQGVGKIGFLKTSNRICVALTRARKGLFIFGNANLLAERSTLWNEVTSSLRSDGELGPKLELYCQNHPHTITSIVTADDFKQVEDGGCSLPCEVQLDCGHACPRRCHPGSHDLVVCLKPCLREYASDSCSHKCNLRCHGSEDCLPCRVMVTKQMPRCEHQQSMNCSVDAKDAFCRSDCPKSLECGHQYRAGCGRPCREICQEKVMKMLPCGHSVRLSCFKDPATFSCEEPCDDLLEDCQHRCKGSCGKCKRGTSHIPCQNRCGRSLPCGHLCEAGCSLSCPPCEKPCQKRCLHSRCSGTCGNLCMPCREVCSWQCEHHQCEKECHEICSRARCNLPCPKTIPECGHPCIGLCGEPCPRKCRVCHPKTLDVITQMTLEEYEEADRFVELSDCAHIFEVSGLDIWMDESNETAQLADGTTPVAVKLKECPECRTLIWKTHRYANVVKTKYLQVEDVKRRVAGFDKTRQGNSMLQKGEHSLALFLFQRALQDYPGLMEAHLGIASTFCVMREYAKAVKHYKFIVERSSFSSVLANLTESARSDGKDHSADMVEKFCKSSSSRTGDSLAMRAIVEWAVALINLRGDISSAVELCDSVLRRDPENSRAKEVKANLQNKHVLEMAVKAMESEVGGRGHWFRCPNGHYYCIGECGGAMQISKCPDCNVEVGGERHKLVAGNSHSNIDGSQRSAWPGN